MVYLTKKIDFNLGYACNSNCQFCYYHQTVNKKKGDRNLTTVQAKKQLELARNIGVKEIEFTGGEPTIRDDFVELVRFAKVELNFPLISLITNGITLSNKDYATELADAGIDDILFSLHGHNADVHESLTKNPESYSKILRAIENLKNLGIRIRTNTVICKPNYRYVSEIVKLLIEQDVDNINLISLNPVLQAKDLKKDLFINYKESARHISSAIDQHRDQLPHINLRYIPFCYLQGLEKYIVNHDQMNFEADEWNNYFSVRLRYGILISLCCAIIGILNLRYKKFAAQFGLNGLLTAGMGRFYVLKNKIKSGKCKKCAYEYICDYIWTNYYRFYGDLEIQPVTGKKIDNPVWLTNAARIRKPGQLKCQMTGQKF